MSLDIYLTVKVDTGDTELYCVELYESNITHNLVPMWKKAGVYEALYKSEGQAAGSIIEVLENGLQLMEESPEEFKLLNPKNGWGTYKDALVFLCGLLMACRKHPKAIVRTW